MEACFPSPPEHVAAKALLLLASNPISSRLSRTTQSYSFSCCNEELPASSSASDSSSSLLTTGDSRKQTRSVALNILATAACCVEKSRKKRQLLKVMNCSQASKCPLVFFRRKSRESFGSATETGDSSLTSRDSSAACITRRRRSGGRHGRMKPEVLRRRQIISPSESARLRPRAEAILSFLAAGRAPEYKIREAIGNSPDTSKALRMLVRQEKVQRSGRGGRKDPFIYGVIATGGLLSEVDSA